MESYLTAEISPSAVRNNLKLLRAELATTTRLCAVVKGDCYGLGVRMLLGVISEFANCLAVATPQEAVALREAGYHGEILLLFPPAAFSADGHRREALSELATHDITLTLVTGDDVPMVSAVARELCTKVRAHVKIDTGMSRGGALPADAIALVNQIRTDEHVHLTGIYTHFARADEGDLDQTAQQLELFMATVESCGPREGVILHAANSAATIQMPQSHLDMVRPGISIYGYHTNDQMHKKLPLKPAFRLWARLMQIKDVPAGSRCGYGLTHKFQRDARIGLVPVGYADGYFRSLSNKAVMRISDRFVPVVGRISMDQTIVDLTDVPQAKVGDVVEIISDDPAAANSVENLARLAGTIPHELITGIGPRARRISAEGTYQAETDSKALPGPAGPPTRRTRSST